MSAIIQTSAKAPVYKVGISFRSSLSADEVRQRYIRPLRKVLKEASAGIYSNYLRQVDPDSTRATEHLIVFELQDFKAGLRVLRVELEQIGLPSDVQFQNLSPSQPGY
ncbi:MAG: hypothetical protein AAGD11_04105 [Planctomycetota bacterium]